MSQPLLGFHLELALDVGEESEEAGSLLSLAFRRGMVVKGLALALLRSKIISEGFLRHFP